MICISKRISLKGIKLCMENNFFPIKIYEQTFVMAFRPEKFSGPSRNGPQFSYYAVYPVATDSRALYYGHQLVVPKMSIITGIVVLHSSWYQVWFSRVVSAHCSGFSSFLFEALEASNETKMSYYRSR